MLSVSNKIHYSPILDVIDIILELQELEIMEEMCSCVPLGSFSPRAITLDECVSSMSSVQ